MPYVWKGDFNADGSYKYVWQEPAPVNNLADMAATNPSTGGNTAGLAQGFDPNADPRGYVAAMYGYDTTQPYASGVYNEKTKTYGPPITRPAPQVSYGTLTTAEVVAKDLTGTIPRGGVTEAAPPTKKDGKWGWWNR